MLAILLLIVLQFAAMTTTPVTVVLDDDHAATAKVLGYRWVLDGQPLSPTPVTTQPPCTSCLERRLDLSVGPHRLVITPYGAEGDETAGAASYDIAVTIVGTGTDIAVNLSLRPVVAATPPPLIISCPANKSVTGLAGTFVTYVSPTTTGGIAPVLVSSAPASGSGFQIGTTTVTASATDAVAKTATCSFTITVAAQVPVVGFRVPEDGPSVKDKAGATWTIGPQENACGQAHPEWCHKILKNNKQAAAWYGAGLYLSKAGTLYVIGDDNNYYVVNAAGTSVSYYGTKSPDAP